MGRILITSLGNIWFRLGLSSSFTFQDGAGADPLNGFANYGASKTLEKHLVVDHSVEVHLWSFDDGLIGMIV